MHGKLQYLGSDGSVNIGSRGWVTGMVVNYRWERVCV